MSSVKKKPNKNKNKISTAAPTPAQTNTQNAAAKPAPKAAPKPAAAAAAPVAATPAARPSLLLSAADDDDTPLQRGAPRKVAAAESSAAATPAAADEAAPKEDVLFGNKRSVVEDNIKKRKAASAAKSAHKKAKAAGEEDDDSPVDLFTGRTTAQTLKHISDPLSHSTLKAGMLVLGAVRAVNEVDLTVQLPHGLTGYVSMREISDSIADIVDKYIEQGERAEIEAANGNTSKSEEESAAAAAITLPVLSDFIRVGQLMHCYILSVGEQTTDSSKHSGATVSANKTRRIEISLRASLFNQNLTLDSLSEGRTLYGSVKSIQEKGYVVDVGIAANTPVAGQTATNITAFLPFDKAPADLLLPTAKRTGRPQKKAAKEESSDSSRRLCVGMPIETVITNAKNKRVLTVTADPKVVRRALMRNSSSQSESTGADEEDESTAFKNAIGFTNLQPGMLVKAEVVSVINTEEQRKSNLRMSGLYVRFLDFFHGVIDNLHSSSDASIEGSLESLFEEGQKLQARILYINFPAKKIALTLLPHIVRFEPFSFPAAVKCGDKITDSIITKVESRHGIFLRLPVTMEGASKSIVEENQLEKKTKKAKKTAAGSDEDEEMAEDAEESGEDDEAEEEEDAEEEQEDVSEEQSLSAWAHISRISDSHLTSVPKNLSVGTTIPCRILNLHYLDGQVHVSTQPHIMEQSILYYEDVTAGTEVQGEIVSVEAFGVLLKLTPHITALIPTLHLSDIHLSDPSKKFKVGQSLKARVLYVEERQKKIICTLKKNLVNSTLPKLLDYKVATPGVVAHGYIASMKDYGLIVEFYNKTHGLVATADLIRTSFLKEGQVPSDVFKRGDVHKVRVVQCDVKKQRLKLSLGLVAPKEESAEEETVIDIIAAPGSIIAATVREVKADGLMLDYEDDAAPAPVKKGKKAPAKRVVHSVYLPAAHLTDHAAQAATLLGTFPVGHRFERLIVLHKDKSLRVPVVSAKPSLLDLSTESESPFTLPSNYDTLQPGQLLLGFVRSVTNFGVFVGFLDHVAALAPRNQIADSFVSGDLSELFQVGQTVRCKVLTVEHREAEAGVPASTKVTVTLKPSERRIASFIDPSITKVGQLMNGRKLNVQIRGISESGANTRLEVTIGEVNSKPVIGLVHMSQLEEALHVRAAAGDKDAKKVLKDHATTPYLPIAAWAKRAGQTVAARIMAVKRKAVKGDASRTHISTIDISLLPSVIAEGEEEVEAGSLPAALPYTSINDIAVGQLIQTYVKDVETIDDQSVIRTVIVPGVSGRIRVNELSFPKGKKADLASFKPGQALTAQVIDVQPQSFNVDLVLLPIGTTKPRKLDQAVVDRLRAEVPVHQHELLKVGSVVRDLTIKRVLPTGLLVAFGSRADHQKFARVHVTDLADAWSKNIIDSFVVGQQIAEAVVIEITTKEETVAMEVDDEDDEEEAKTTTKTHVQIDLSLRPSRLTPAEASAPKFPEITSFDDLVGKEGSLIQGFVRSTSKVGCFISLSHNVTARCLLKNLSDGYVTDIAKHFPAGKFLPHVRIAKVDPAARTIEVSLRKGDSRDVPAGESLYKFEDLSVGDNVKGVVTQIKPFGLFIRLKDSSLSGLCHISEVSETFIDDLSKHYEVGDKVRARVVKKDDETRKISLGLKAKYFEDQSDSEADEAEEEEAEDDDEEDEDEEMEDAEEDEEDAIPPPPTKQSVKRKAAAAESSESEEEVEMDDARAHKKPRVTAAAAESLTALPSTLVDDGEMADAPALDLNSNFNMLLGGAQKAVAEDDEEDEEEEDDDAEDAASKKKSRRAKAGAKKAEERALLTREHAILDPNAQPESAEEFERIIVQNPNASMVWIKFMAYQISLTEIEKARKVAERALKAISFRSPQEKLNVWIALLNLENMYGTQKTMQEVFNRAVQFNEPITVYMEVAKIYAATKKVEQCVETYEGALKKFHGAASIWTAYAQFLYTVPARIPDARDLLKRALQRLDKSEHIALICKFASLEFHVANNVDRGRTLMEGVLSNYPKRVDLWNVYLDMEVKLGAKLTELRGGVAPSAKDPNALNHESIRRLFDRITSLNLSTKKMKHFFKRNLTWEKTAGGADPERLERVKDRAREYVASKTNQDE